VCGSEDHWASQCPDRKFQQEKKSANVVTTDTSGGTSGYGNSLPFVLSVCNSPEWWMDSGANIHVCADFFFAFFIPGREVWRPVAGKWVTCACSWCWCGHSEVYLGKTVPLNSMQHVPSIKKNLVSASLLCHDGYRVVLESNKCVVSKHGSFVGKGYDCGGLFRLSLHDVCNKLVNSVDISDELDLWHSQFCHTSYGCPMRLALIST